MYTVKIDMSFCWNYMNQSSVKNDMIYNNLIIFSIKMKQEPLKLLITYASNLIIIRSMNI